MKIAVGFLVAYDFELLKRSIPLIYKDASTIILGLDKNRVSFTGNFFYFNEQFKEWVNQFDKHKKVVWVEGNFYKPSLSPMENETRERNILFKNITNADWYIQLDADEYFLDFSGFVRYLGELSQNIIDNQPVTVTVYWKTLFKKIKSGYLAIDGTLEKIGLASNNPVYTYARTCGEQKIVNAPFFVIHDSWAREESEIRQKLYNWSHSNDINLKSFFKTWKFVKKWNYKHFTNFHPINGPIWQALEFVSANNVEELVQYYTIHPPKIAVVTNKKTFLGGLRIRIKKLLPSIVP